MTISLIPLQTPRLTNYFTGRKRYLLLMRDYLLSKGENASLQNTFVIYGMAGTGKTTLAKAFATEYSKFFTDGIIWADLRTFSTISLLDMIGISFGYNLSLTADVNVKSSIVKSILYERNILLVLDNAEDVNNVEPLIPGGSKCKVLITTRESSLGYFLGAKQTELEPFDRNEAFSFAQKMNPEQMDFQLLLELFELLGYLPLAIEIMFGVLLTRKITLAEAISEIRSASNRIKLQFGEKSIKLAFDLSFGMLRKKEQDGFIALGAFAPGIIQREDFNNLVSKTIGDLPELVQTLVDKSLVNLITNDKIALHPLLYDYARQKLENLPEEAFCMNHANFYYKIVQNLAITITSNPLIVMEEFRNRLSNIQYALTWYSNNSYFHSYCKMVLQVDPLLGKAGYWEYREFILKSALAQIGSDKKDYFILKADILHSLGVALRHQGDLGSSELILNECKRIRSQLGLKYAESRTNYELARIAEAKNEDQNAEKLYLEILDLMEGIDEIDFYTFALYRLGEISFRKGDFKRAKRYYKQALPLFRKIENQRGIVDTLGNLGRISGAENNHKDSNKYINSCLRYEKKLRIKNDLPMTLRSMGEIAKECGKIDEAKRLLIKSIEFAEQMQDASGVVEASFLLGSILMQYGKLLEASQYFQKGFEISSKQMFPDTDRFTSALRSLQNMGVQMNKVEDKVNDILMTQMITQVKVLFLAADPSDQARLRLGEEFREIQQKLQMAKLRDRFDLQIRLSVRPSDISQALLDITPQIVHFAGHGTSSGCLCIENEIGKTVEVTPTSLAELFSQFSSQITCVLLNACFSERQANIIKQYIDYVIGMNIEISDRAAIAFSVGFYQGLGAGKTIEESYRLGCAQIKLWGISSALQPVLLKKHQ